MIEKIITFDGMEGNVYITGQIGTTYNQDMTVKEKGVEVIDVVSQLEPLKACEKINVWIDSPGGSVEVGEAISKYLASCKNVFTIASNFCASIATHIHLSVPIENRKIIQGTAYMIHNPLIQNFSGNAAEMIEVASILKPIQQTLVKMYVKQTGVSKEAIQQLMNVESALTDDQLLSLGFVSEILPKKTMQAVAFVDKKLITNPKPMSKGNLNLWQRFAATMKGRNIQSIIQDVEQGQIETPFADIMVGDPIMLDGEAAPAGTYVLEDGTQLVVVEAGAISEIIKSDGENVDYTELLAKFTALETENTTLRSEVDALKTQVQSLVDGNETEEETPEEKAAIAAFKAKVSKYTPPVNSVTRKQSGGGLSGVAAQQARRAQLQTPKK